MHPGIGDASSNIRVFQCVRWRMMGVVLLMRWLLGYNAENLIEDYI
jgi:hypothetical protein